MTATIHAFPARERIPAATPDEIALYGEPAPRSRVTLDWLSFWAATFFCAFSVGVLIGAMIAVAMKAIE